MEGVAKIEAEPKLDNRNMIMVLAPDKRARQAAASRTANQHRGDREPSTNGSGAVEVDGAEETPAEATATTAAVATAESVESATTEEG
jgi:hypothetical protein